jgi:hypothetical protein
VVGKVALAAEQAVAIVEPAIISSSMRTGRRWRRDRVGIEPLTGTHLEFI